MEDLGHCRAVLERHAPDRGELRRLSNVLRRFLIDSGGDVCSIAPARVGKISILGPDNNPVYESDKKLPFKFFGSGGARAFGVYMRAAQVELGPSARQIDGFDPERTVTFSHDGFLNQKVICLRGRWINRRDVIKYIANVASGVHSGGTPASDADKIAAIARNCVSYSLRDDIGRVVFNPGATEKNSADFEYSVTAIDPILFELLCSAHYFVSSPKILELESAIKLELGIP